MIYARKLSNSMIDHTSRPFALTGYELRMEREKQFELNKTVIDIKLNFEEKAVEGKVELNIKMNSLPQDSLEIDAEDMEIYNVSVKGVPVKFDTYPKKIIIYGEFRAFGEYILTITYKSFPKKGGYFVNDDGGMQFWTQGEDTDNHAWFPCFDYPNMRSAYEIRVTVPRDYTVISNGSLRERVDGDFSTFVFVEDFRFPSYLVSVVAGKFQELKQEWEGIPIRSHFLPKYSGLAERSFRNSADMMEFISQKTGIKYPYSKYDQTCVSDFVFGGMENLSATTLTDRTIHDEIAHLDYQSESLICHEMAHQWFGDYVTCKDWSQAWLNEGFATFIALIYMEKFKGKEEFLVDVENTREIYLKEYGERYERPVVERMYKDPAELFDRHLYQKASLFIRYLNYYLGDKVFWAGVKDYLENNKMSGVSTEDFRKSLSRVSGFSFEEVFQQFVDQPGHPSFSVRETSSKGKVIVKIRQKGRLFTLRLPIRIYREGKTEEMEIKVNEEVTEIELEKKDFRGFSLDPESLVLKTTETERPKEEARYILLNGTTVIERAAAAAELSKYGISEIPFLEEAFEQEKFWYVKGKIADSVSKIGSDRAVTALLKMLDEGDYRARSEVVKAASNIRDEKLFSKLSEMFGNEKGYRIRANILQSAQKTGREKSTELLLKGLEIESYDDWIRIAALNSLGEIGDLSLLPVIKKYGGKGYGWRVRAEAVNAISKFYWKDRTIAVFLLDALKDPFFAVRNATVEGIKHTEDAELISKLANYLEGETDGRVRRTIREALEFKAQPLPQEFESIKEEVDKLRERVAKLETKIKIKR
jgi:aminopeptidase N